MGSRRFRPPKALPMGNRRPLRAAAAAVAAMAVLSAATAACGGSAETDPAAASPEQRADRPVGTVIRLAIPPDPLWDWLNNSGTLAEWEQANSARVDAIQAFDQFGAFAGGHADIVVINAMDVPNVERQSGREAVIVGKYTFDRSFIGVRRYSSAETLADLGGTRIAVYSPVESTLVWGVIAKDRHDLHLRLDGGDFDMVVAEPAQLADLVMRGDVDACICLPDLSATHLAERELKALYGGRPAARVYAEETAADPAAGQPIADALVADKAWYEQNTEVAESFLSLWSRALEEWQRDRSYLISTYSHHFSVQGDEQIDWLTAYIEQNDWIAPSPYVSDREAKNLADTFSRMKGADLIDQDTAEPEIIVSSTSGSGS